MRAPIRLLGWVGAAASAAAQANIFLSDFPSDAPSDVPSMVPSDSPSLVPTIEDGAFVDSCNICGDDKVVGSSETVVSDGTSSITCGDLEQLGLQGQLDEETCTQVTLAASVLCECKEIEEAGETSVPTTSPGLLPDVSPGECSTATCTEFESSVDVRLRATGGAQLCACAFDFSVENGKCLGTSEDTIRVTRGQDVTFSCASGEICRLACPHTSMSVESGGAGHLQNIVLTGGSRDTRVFVGSGGLFYGKNLNFTE